MRISDWSSDVCSSDLFLLHRPQQAARLVEIAVVGPTVERGEALLPGIRAAATVGGTISARAVPRHADEERTIMPIVGRDRKRVGQGKSVSVRVALGGGRIVKKKKNKHQRNGDL